MPSPYSHSSSSNSSWMVGRHFHLMSHRSIKTRFAYRFLRALKKLNNNKKPIIMEKKLTTSRRKRRRRYHMVKTAAYVSMASAVGTKRAWSRALLSKIRNRGRTNTILLHRRHHHPRDQNPNNDNKKEEEEATTEQLKKLVPGGEVMDFCSLLDETAHYIKCLTSQVQIMRNILDFYSP